MEITEQIRAIKALEAERAAEKAAFEAAQQESAKRLYVMRKDLQIVQSGLNAEKVHLGLSILDLRGSYARGGEGRTGVIDDAIAWFLDPPNSAIDLRTKFLGTKNYDRFSGQRVNCEYGMRPRHGDVVFGVGLKPTYRDPAFAFTDKQVEACVYTLSCLEAVQLAQALAAD